jgi:hypothetical protein
MHKLLLLRAMTLIKSSFNVLLLQTLSKLAAILKSSPSSPLPQQTSSLPLPKVRKASKAQQDKPERKAPKAKMAKMALPVRKVRKEK